MKRSLLIIVALFVTLSVYSQNYKKAIGFRAGSSIGISYKQFMTETEAAEAIFDIDFTGRRTTKVKASAYYLRHFDVNVDGLSLYAGPGASAGVFIEGLYQNNFVMSLDIMGGVEYKFNNIPVVLACDWTPKYQFITLAGFRSGNFGLTVRYTF